MQWPVREVDGDGLCRPSRLADFRSWPLLFVALAIAARAIALWVDSSVLNNDSSASLAAVYRLTP